MYVCDHDEGNGTNEFSSLSDFELCCSSKLNCNKVLYTSLFLAPLTFYIFLCFVFDKVQKNR